MITTISKMQDTLNFERASNNFAWLMEFVAGLYCADGTSSLSTGDMHELTASVCYTLGIAGASPQQVARILASENPIALWRANVAELNRRTDAALGLWREIVTSMPPIRNVSLRDTLASLGDIKRKYDVYFAAHEVPCDIDYQLSTPVDSRLMGIDYIEAWLGQLLIETRWIAQFDVASCIDILERACPDYRGLHVNLYELLLPHKGELVKASANQ